MVFATHEATVVSDELSLPAMARQLPAPLLPDALRPPYYRAAFAAALHKPPTPFDAHPGTSLPPLDVWLTSLFAGSRVSPSVFVAVLVYMDRLLANCPALQLTAANVHRIVAACFVLAVKELEDNPIWTPHMAVLTGISLFELKGLEMAALRLLDYRTYIPVSEFERAEAIFIAEAVDAAEEEGLQLIMTLAAMRVTEGLDRAIAHVQSWDHMEPSHQQPAQSQGTTCVWTRVPGGPAPPRDWTVKLCATAAALADLLFPGIPLRPRRTCQPEALVLAAWGIPGVLRFRALKGLVLNAEMADLDLVLPPLVKGAHLSRDLRRVRRTHKPAMGRTGAFLVAEQWDLVQPADEDDVPLLFGERAILTPYRDATSTPPCFRPTPQPRFVALPIPDDPQHPPTHYPLGLEPCTPPPSEHLWNHWWAEKRLAQLEREFEDRVLQGMVDNGRLYAVDSRRRLLIAAGPAGLHAHPLRRRRQRRRASRRGYAAVWQLWGYRGPQHLGRRGRSATGTRAGGMACPRCCFRGRGRRPRRLAGRRGRRQRRRRQQQQQRHDRHGLDAGGGLPTPLGNHPTPTLDDAMARASRNRRRMERRAERQRDRWLGGGAAQRVRVGQ
ncbi:unnamed protein product [Chondrus crispus]|uniref:Cyclin-like domain-containing protein n=1 Tax=Chondrus crispus TaxID=2769 RepID=R7QPH5_CHOCR|nr:unnamed protein product [Chondrus crispus]CDF39974.1 unnamed protein product [Chondrus crispus]|eukprot:XP_005710268.1 unnamed protein product [Chondrus crispus]